MGFDSSQEIVSTDDKNTSCWFWNVVIQIFIAAPPRAASVPTLVVPGASIVLFTDTFVMLIEIEKIESKKAQLRC